MGTSDSHDKPTFSAPSQFAQTKVIRRFLVNQAVFAGHTIASFAVAAAFNEKILILPNAPEGRHSSPKQEDAERGTVVIYPHQSTNHE